ncbi:MAG: hypothetical protein ACREC0_12925 [Methylocella sp.]
MSQLRGSDVTKIDTRTSAPEYVAQREVVLTRVFEAPRGLVWKAFTEPDRSLDLCGRDLDGRVDRARHDELSRQGGRESR